MKVTGIICEYNPLHKGHSKQLQTVRAQISGDDGIVCLMSGNYVQRGAPAIFDKTCRAKAAVLCGADLVLELPVTASLSSAEGFAAGGVRILSDFCQDLSFGAESSDPEKLMQIAHALLEPTFAEHLHQQLDKGMSFPAARQAALASLGVDADLLSKPNNILGVEYCKAILAQNCSMMISPIHRSGDYHDVTADSENPSATAVRELICNRKPWAHLIPDAAAPCFENAAVHTLQAGERAVLSKLRCMDDNEFEALPYGSEGLWRKLMHAVRSNASLEDIINDVKSKRYTRSRIDRMIMCAFLGLTEQMISNPAPYVRVLAFNEKGRSILKQARTNGQFPNLGQTVDNSYQQFESKWDDLYGLFAADTPESAGANKSYRVYNHI